MFDLNRDIRSWSKAGVVMVLPVMLAAVHVGGAQHNMTLHLLHRELFFIPVLLGAFWFGLRGGVVTAVAAGALYVPLLSNNATHFSSSMLAVQVLVFLFVGALLGWLADRERSHKASAAQAEGQAAMGRAAVAMGGEMHDILADLRDLTECKADQDLSKDPEYSAALQRLQTLVDALGAYSPRDIEEALGADLNGIIRKQIKRCRQKAGKAGVTLHTELDPKGCPSCVDTEHIGALIAGLVENAVEASRQGQQVTVTSKRTVDGCEVQVRDEGVGIQPEHLEKLFNPFFTTKPDGYGLTLAAGRKVVESLGGELTAQSTPGQGATFTLQLPREAACEE